MAPMRHGGATACLAAGAESSLSLGERSLPNSHTDAALYTRLVDRLAPWLFEVGSWTFGGLIATTMLVLAALFTVGPVDVAVALSTAAFAVALPLDVSGLVLVRIVQHLTRFEDSVLQVFQESGFA